jgi:hypothetical protein
LGFFRLVCSNGLILGDAVGAQFKVYHSSIDLEQKLLNSLNEALDAVPRIMQLKSEWQAKVLTYDQEIDLAVDFARYLEDKRGLAYINPSDLLRARRGEDIGSTLWQVYNRMQENALKPLPSACQVDEHGVLTPIKTKQVRAIKATTDINKELVNMIFSKVG